MKYAELHAHSNFTLLDGGSHPEELISCAAELDYAGIAITDRDGLYGAVRFAQAGREDKVEAIIGAELTMDDASHLIVLAEDATGYANLSRLISRARLDHPRGEPKTGYDLLARHTRGLIALSGCRHGAVPRQLEQGDFRAACEMAGRLRDMFGWGNVWIELQRHLEPDDGPRIRALTSLAQTLELGIVATGGVHYAKPEHRELADVLACTRLKTTLEEAGTQLRPNGEYYLRSADVMARLFSEHPRAVTNSVAIAQRCGFRLRKLENEFPDFPLPPNETLFSYLYKLVHEGVQRRYRPVTPDVSKQIAHELSVIERLDLAGYFLIVWDMVRFARERNILVQGRGSAANSAVCYALGITSVDPVGLKLLFERFLSEERDEPPDIDLDTPSGDQREALIQYIYERYGREHAGMVAEVITYRARSAVRDIGKALGLSLDQVDALAKSLDTGSASHVGDEAKQIDGHTNGQCSNRPLGPLPPHEQLQVTKHGEHLPMTATEVEKAVANLPQALRVDLRGDVARRLYALCRRIDGFPRHLSQHVGGMVITRSPLIEIAPLEPAAMPDRTILCWDKDDCATLGLIKIDILGLGMLNAIELALADIERSREVQIDFADLRACNDEAVYDMLCESDTVGLFQVESRAQMATLPRLRPRCFYDIAVQVAIIRPGPIQGDMVHPYIRRRRGLEPVTYPHPKLKPVLERTLGVPLFQEQGMRLAIEAAGFTPGQADELRRAMGHKRSHEKMAKLHGRLLDGMERNGIDRELADRLFQMLSAFADYGFPESHAASFALIVYVSAFLKRYYAPEFFAALLNAQPMGFYSPSTLIGDARRHNVMVLPPDVNASRFECTVEPLPHFSEYNGQLSVDRPLSNIVTHAWEHPVVLRIGLSLVHGIGEKHKATLNAERDRGPYKDMRDFVLRTQLPKDILESLSSVGAFSCFSMERRAAYWDVQRLGNLKGAGALEQGMTVDETAVAFPPMHVKEEAAADYRGLGLSTRYQIMEFYRPQLDAVRVRRACDLRTLPNRLVLKVAGVVTIRQRPGTAKGFVFTTMEDETGLINVIIRPDIYQRYRSLARDEPTVVVEGVLQKQDGHVNVLARRFWKLDTQGLTDGLDSRDFH